MTWQKMSKSKLNGVNPSGLISRYGSDALRVAILFKAPLEVHMHWEESDITGAQRWIQRLLNLTLKHSGDTPKDEKVEDAVNRAARNVTRDLEAYSFNTCIAHLMTLTGALETLKPDSESMRKLATLLYPFAPLAAAEIYSNASLSDTNDIRLASWPVVVDAKKGAVIVVQRNGKKVGTMEVQDDISRKEVMETAKLKFPGQLHDIGATENAVYVEGRVLNFVVKDSVKCK